MLGYPILSVRSIPQRREVPRSLLQGGPRERAACKTPLELNHVWPENYSVNSAQKVWAAGFAAHHPNVVVLDLSSFKCGHDAPTYGLIDSIIEASKTPYAALHDIDANKPSGQHQDPREDVRPRAQAPRGAPAGRAQAQGRARARDRPASASSSSSSGSEQLDGAPASTTRRSSDADRRASRRAFAAYESASRRRPSWPSRRRASSSSARRPPTASCRSHARTTQPTAAESSEDHRQSNERFGQARTAHERRRPSKTSSRSRSSTSTPSCKKFEEEERKRLGLDEQTEQWIEDMANLTFTKKEKANITILVGGLTMAHDYFVEAGLRGIGYNVQMLDVPGQRGAPVRQGVRQPRPVQPDVLHRRQPGEVPLHAARQARDDGEGDRQEVRLPHGRRVRPVPLRHVRHRVPQGAPRRRLRRLPRRALPADRRPEAGDRRGERPRADPDVLLGAS